MSLYANQPWNFSPFDQIDMSDSFLLSKDFTFLSPEPTEFVLRPEDQLGRSIHRDCKLLESNETKIPQSDIAEIFEFNENLPKYEIRNHDCMWSGLCKNDNKKNPNIYNKRLTATTTTTMTTMNQLNSNSSIVKTTTTTTSISSNTTTILNQNTNGQKLNTQIKSTFINNNNNNNINNAPPGTSLLINSRLNNDKKNCKISIPTILTSDFLKERECLSLMRPDTPLSLDDDPPEFKHNVDLAAFVMGSNNISLLEHGLTTLTKPLIPKTTIQQQHLSLYEKQSNDIDNVIINKLKEQLEDTTKENIDIKKILPNGNKTRSLSEVLNVIGNYDDDILDMDSDETDDDDDDDNASTTIDYTSSVSYSSNYPPAKHSDHSYTRSKNGVDVISLGVQTPSDSDEEIDVVSIGDKKLPTNPSDRDRRALQNRVANKISARIVKTAGGIKTILPRRRCTRPNQLTPSKNSYYSPKSISSSSSSSITTPYNYPSTPTSKYSSTTTSSRKRYYGSSSNDEYLPTNKRYRGKKRSSIRRHISDSDEAETIEKRHLHNDMERQRRIGLKNLFDSLKKQIPNIKDKDRAPKVTILREAAKLCSQINREERNLYSAKQQLQLQLQQQHALLWALKDNKPKFL